MHIKIFEYTYNHYIQVNNNCDCMWLINVFQLYSYYTLLCEIFLRMIRQKVPNTWTIKLQKICSAKYLVLSTCINLIYLHWCNHRSNVECERTVHKYLDAVDTTYTVYNMLLIIINKNGLWLNNDGLKYTDYIIYRHVMKNYFSVRIQICVKSSKFYNNMNFNFNLFL